jgi:hypothetical protein
LATKNGRQTAGAYLLKYAKNKHPCSTNPRVYIMVANTFQPVPLAQETRAALPTPEAAYHLNRATQTLRLWAMRNDGPVKCLRVGGRLAWPVADIKRVMGVA